MTRILSLDGGGSWAMIQVRVLQKKYGDDTLGHDVICDYDYVIANSGGSLVLAAMMVNMKLSDILEMFRSQKILESIFVKKLRAKLFPFLNGFAPRFKTEFKLQGLKDQLGPNCMKKLIDFPDYIGDKCPKIVICGFDYDRRRATFFRTDLNSRLESPNNNPGTVSIKNTITLLHAVHASSNAPVQFFDDPAEVDFIQTQTGQKSKRLFWDGAIGAYNNPAFAGLLEAIGNGVNINDIKIVSIGTANVIRPVLYANDSTHDHDFMFVRSQIEGYFSDIEKMATSIVSDPPDAATYQAHIVMGLSDSSPSEKLVRINPLIKPILTTNNGWIMPGVNWSASDMKALFDLDMAVTKSTDLALIDRLIYDFFDDKFDNQGVRIGGKGLEAVIGHKTFSSAMNDW